MSKSACRQNRKNVPRPHLGALLGCFWGAFRNLGANKDRLLSLLGSFQKTTKIGNPKSLSILPPGPLFWASKSQGKPVVASAPKNDDVQFPADNKKKLQLLKAYQGAARTGKHQGTISGNGFSVVVLMWAGRVHGRNAFRPGRDLTRNSAELLAACLSMAAASAFAPMANLRHEKFFLP